MRRSRSLAEIYFTAKVRTRKVGHLPLGTVRRDEIGGASGAILSVLRGSALTKRSNRRRGLGRWGAFGSGLLLHRQIASDQALQFLDIRPATVAQPFFYRRTERRQLLPALKTETPNPRPPQQIHDTIGFALHQ